MKRQIKRLLLGLRIPRLMASAGPTMAVILRYHSIQPVPRDYSNTIGEGIIHSEDLFKQQMEVVSRQFNPITLDDIVAWLRDGRPIPKRAVAVTFDDGFTDNSEIAAPILHHYAVPAAFYLTVGSINTTQDPWFCRLRRAFSKTSIPHWTDPSTGLIFDNTTSTNREEGFLAACRTCAVLTGERQTEFLSRLENNFRVTALMSGSRLMMNWDQITALKNNGHIIGSHTMSHSNLAHSAPEDVRHELMESKQILEQKLGTRILHFSYPSPILEPHCSHGTTALVSQCGYASAVTCIPGPVRATHTPLLLRRVSAPDTLDDFVWGLEASLAGYVL